MADDESTGARATYDPASPILNPKEVEVPLADLEAAVASMEAIAEMFMFDAAVAKAELVEATEVAPHLWLGSKKAARNLEWLRSKKIGAILNMAAGDCDAPEGGYPEDMRMMRIEAEDDVTYPLLERHLAQSFEFIRSCLTEEPTPRPILVHCVQGLNRSGSSDSEFGRVPIVAEV
eukprot:TRINITY_DN28649_c0_g1_i2.p1 TRINITY_DN28649_c0_g1~~TRINITY_DN28649_c0_g1_i2.p1  ORF type:complete len:176 (-),score=47.82 TRINITY_DN28649_c0_g1_i2:118-645(-)